MTEPYRVLVTTSDKYLPALLPFSYLFNKYWGSDVHVEVFGFSRPGFDLPDNFKFTSLGSQGAYPFNKWTDALIAAMSIINDEAFVLMLDDYWITRPVNRPAIRILYDYIIQFKYVLKIDLCADRLYAFGADLEYATVAYLDLVKSMPGSPYHMSLWPGMWRKDLLSRCLIPGESPHDLEMVGSTRVSHMQDMIVLGTRQWPLKITLGLRGGDHSSINLDGLSKVDIDAMQELGYFEIYGE